MRLQSRLEEQQAHGEQVIFLIPMAVSYCKRHSVQEEKAKQDINSKSYRSLKNQGHDAQKALMLVA
jgi:hypothetical protein